MEWLTYFLDLVLHVDKHLGELIAAYGPATYAILFGIVFLETGIVFTPFLPGDSLIFAAGALAAKKDATLSPHVLFVVLSAAAILGDTVNYWIGKFLGPRLLRGGAGSRFLKKEYLDKTHEYFEKYGGATIIIARFVPIVRTFAPFVAGIGAMTYRAFLFYNIVGGVLWVGLCNYAGWLFGNIPVVEKNFTLVILVIIVLSIVPGVIEFARHRRKATRAAARSAAPAEPPAAQ